MVKLVNQRQKINYSTKPPFQLQNDTFPKNSTTNAKKAKPDTKNDL